LGAVKAKTKKAMSGLVAVVAVSVAFFSFGCSSSELWAILAAILLLSGKELEEFRRLKDGKN
jgi:hypothetical protein